MGEIIKPAELINLPKRLATNEQPWSPCEDQDRTICVCNSCCLSSKYALILIFGAQLEVNYALLPSSLMSD